MQNTLFRLSLSPWAVCGFFHTQIGPLSRKTGFGLLSVRGLPQKRYFSEQPRIMSRHTLLMANARRAPPTTNRQHWLSTSPRSYLRYHARQNPRKPPFLGFLDKIPENTIFYGVIGLNSVVFIMWFMAVQKYKQEGDPSSVIWMQENFTNSWKNISSGRIWTPLASCFSHRDWSHILLNGFTFFFMAPPVLQMLGSRQFIFLYFGGGLVSSFASTTYAKWVGKNDYASHGASGAIYSVVSLLACIAPTLTFQLYGIIPVPAWLAVSGFFAYDLYSTMSNKNGTTDTVGHIGGILAGIGYFFIRRFRVF
ncbi:hypothetical protein GALMADRAFT_250548 [Galerina marginata CBS 339.88]|uniref:Peptidase S54 rhomboid domain-containing protein n=1 Tax=Galerina marginata (strain CBS 339.88) TaxID=685588 RepID=A0A067T3P1_GALM3|nr:hypothetical protein GALMADRAFT_250548 [Galerina marginata CBS 339.88]